MAGKETYEVNASKCGQEDVVLKYLLEAFGSEFSLDEIASAYLKANYSADLAAEILYERQGSTPISASNGEVGNGGNSGKISENSHQVNGSRKTAKPKIRPFSVGTVSSVIGKEYTRSKPSGTQATPVKVYKPVKVGVKVLHEPSSEGDRTSFTSESHLHQDMEDFLFKMLGDGFNLKREVIRDVLGSCGYDMKKSMESLLHRSTTSVEERRGSGNKPNDTTTALSSSTGGNGNMASSKKGLELTNLGKTRFDLQKEILTTLFNASEEPEEELPRRRVVSKMKRSGAFGKLVTEPLKDMDAEDEKRLELEAQNILDVDDEGSRYQLLRKAVREYRSTMNEYYAAAIDAFAKGDSVRAAKLTDEGHFFRKKAQDADEQSCQLIFEPRNADTEDDEILLDLHDLDGREAVKVLKSQISSLSEIPSINRLKVIIEANDKDTSKRSCRRLVIKLLEKESIEWTEDENSGSILIRLDTIDRKQLSFVKRMD